MILYNIIQIYSCILPSSPPIIMASFEDINYAFLHKETCEKNCNQCKFEIQEEIIK